MEKVEAIPPLPTPSIFRQILEISQSDDKDDSNDAVNPRWQDLKPFNTTGSIAQGRVRRRFCACTYEFLTTVTERVTHSVHKVVIWSSFGVIWRQKVDGGKQTCLHCDRRWHNRISNGS